VAVELDLVDLSRAGQTAGLLLQARRCLLLLPRAGSHLPPLWQMPSRREGMQFCNPSLLHRQFASRSASSVGGYPEHAQ
jgi:hypothetical protein